MEQKGITIHNKVTISKIEEEGQMHKIHLSNNKSLSVETVMGATGRLPKVSNLGLEEIGVDLGKRGEVLVNNFNQTNINSIFAIGDVTDKITLTPVAIAEGHSFADREFGKINSL